MESAARVETPGISLIHDRMLTSRKTQPDTPVRVRFNEARDLLARHKALPTGTRLEVEGLDIEVHSNVLSPTLTTTSRFFAQAIVDQKPVGTILEMGIGTGFCLCKIGQATPGAKLFGADINPDAVALARRNLAHNGLSGVIYESDLYDGIEPGLAFDMIVFNPPLLFAQPLNELELAIFDAEGATVRRFLAGLESALNPGGRSVILSTDRNSREGKAQPFADLLDSFGFRHTVVAKLDRGFEIYSAHVVEV